MKYQKHGINPLLISIATSQDLAAIPLRPTTAMLPGKYPKLVYKHMKKINSAFPENIFRLTCGECGKSGDYDLGTLAVSAILEAEDWDDNVQVLGYFRCKHCNAAGAWEFSARSKTMLAPKMAVMTGDQADERSQGNGVVLGQVLIDGSFSPQWGSDAEEYFLKKLKSVPHDAYLWNRLGNIYTKGKRPELAVVAYEQSLIYDPGQVESHFSLGQVLVDTGDLALAAKHLRQAVAFACRYSYLTATDLREMIVTALVTLIAIHNHSGAKIDMLPGPEELIVGSLSKSEIAAANTLDFDIDIGSRECLYPVAEVYMGARREELSPENRSVHIPRPKATWPSSAKVNKQKPLKKNRKKKRK